MLNYFPKKKNQFQKKQTMFNVKYKKQTGNVT